MKFNSIQNSFSSGELSRRLKGRTNIEEYLQGLATMSNFIPDRVGGANFRAGTCVKSSEHALSVPGAIVNFTPRDGETYTIILQPGSSIVAAECAITQPSYVWNTRPDFTDSSTRYIHTINVTEAATRKKVDSLQYAQAGDVLIIVDGEGILAPIVIFRVAQNVLYADSLIYPQQTNAATALPYLYPPPYHARVPYKDTNVNTNIQMKPSATTAAGTSITITAQNASASALSFFTGDPVGMIIKITQGGTNTGVARVTSKTSSSVVNAVVIVAFSAVTASSNFELSAWNPMYGYPRSVAFFEQRLVLGGSTSNVDTIWCSMTGNIYFFMQRRLQQDVATSDVTGIGFYGTSVKASDPFNFVPAAVGANAIQWLYPGDSLLCGTTTNEFAISGGNDSVFSVSSIFIKTISSHGSAKVQAVKAGGSVIFVAGNGKRVMEIPSNLSNYLAATDLSIMSDGILDAAIEATTATPKTLVKAQNKITKLAWNEYDGVLWVLCRNSNVGSYGYSNSALLSITMDKTSKVLGWAKHPIGGNPSISSICISPDVTNPGSARLSMLNLRALSGIGTISGLSAATAQTLEYLSYRNQYDAYYTGDPADATYGGRNAVYMDCTCIAKSATGGDGTIALVTSGQITLSGVQQDVFCSGDKFGVVEINSDVGTYLGEFTVGASGNLTVPGAVNTKTYLVGKLYEGQIMTMPLEAGAQFGVAQGSNRRSNKIVIFLNRSLGGVYKSLAGNNYFDLLRATDATPSALFTGERELILNASYNDAQTIVKQTKPYPMNILWLLHKGVTYDS